MPSHPFFSLPFSINIINMNQRLPVWRHINIGTIDTANKQQSTKKKVDSRLDYPKLTSHFSYISYTYYWLSAGYAEITYTRSYTGSYTCYYSSKEPRSIRRFFRYSAAFNFTKTAHLHADNTLKLDSPIVADKVSVTLGLFVPTPRTKAGTFVNHSENIASGVGKYYVWCR